MDNGCDQNYEDEPDETMVERLYGLTEMFSASFRNTVSTGVKGILTSVKIFVSKHWTVMLTSVYLILWAHLIQKINRLE